MYLVVLHFNIRCTYSICFTSVSFYSCNGMITEVRMASLLFHKKTIIVIFNSRYLPFLGIHDFHIHSQEM